MNALTNMIQKLSSEFESKFVPTLKGKRKVGREAEYPVVKENGEAADVQLLWPDLAKKFSCKTLYDGGAKEGVIVSLEGEKYSYSLEVGKGTMEVITGPCENLLALKKVHEEAVGLLVEVAKVHGFRVLGSGIQPLTKPSLELMSPKHRYKVLHKVLGDDWLWFTVTASDQIHVDIARSEIVEMMNYGNLIAPLIVAFCANSSVLEGRSYPMCSLREGNMGNIMKAENRHGMVLRPFKSVEEFISRMSSKICLVTREDGVIQAYSGKFSDYLLEHGPNFDAFLLHEHYIWNSARARSAHSTIEIRPACQQPWHEHMAFCALAVGLIEARKPVMEFVEKKLGKDYWPILTETHLAVVQKGLQAPEPTPDFLKTILGFTETALKARGFGEEVLMQPLWKRLQLKMNPAQTSRKIFAEKGLKGLMDVLTVSE